MTLLKQLQGDGTIRHLLHPNALIFAFYLFSVFFFYTKWRNTNEFPAAFFSVTHHVGVSFVSSLFFFQLILFFPSVFSMQVTSYIEQNGSSCLLQGAVIISAPWNPFHSSHSLEKLLDIWTLNAYLTKHLKLSVERYAKTGLNIRRVILFVVTF